MMRGAFVVLCLICVCGCTAASAPCELLALEVWDTNLKPRLIVIDSAAGGNEIDLTTLAATAFGLVRIQLSAAGTRLAISSQAEFEVIDIPARGIVAKGKGRYASLSPDGKTLAFVDASESFVLLSLETGAKKKLLAGYSAMEVGPWSPDGRFLLAGVATIQWASAERMIVADVDGDSYLPIEDIDDPGPGVSEHGWIKRSLLVP